MIQAKPPWDNLLVELKDQYGEIVLKKRIISNGAWQVTAYTFCGNNFIKHISLKVIPLNVFEAMPVEADFRENNPLCEICGQNGTELHHWGPRHLFEDYYRWPTSYLCKKHHNQWHTIIKKHK